MRTANAKPMNGAYRTSLLVLVGILVTGIGAWLTFGLDKVSRPELREAVAEVRTQVAETEDRLAAETNDLRSVVRGLRDDVQTLSQNVARLNALLEGR